MPIVEVNGQELEFPDDMQPDAIKTVLQKKFPKPIQEAPEAKVNNLMAGIISSLAARGAGLNNIVNATQQGKRSIPEGIFQGMMNEVGAAGDVVGNVANTIAATPMPQLGGASAKDLMQLAQISSPTVNNAMRDIQKGAGAYEKNLETYNKENPRMGANLQAVREASALVPIPGFGKSAMGITKGISSEVAQGTKGMFQKGINSLEGTLTELKKPIKTSDDIKALASGFYKDAETKGGILKPEFINKFVEKVDSLKPQTEHGKIIVGDTALTSLSDRIAALKNKPTSLQAAQEMDEGLGELIDGYVDRTTGKLTKEGKKLYDVQSEFRDMIEKADDNMLIGKEGFDSWKQGKKLWAASRKMADVERIISRAEMMDNPATGIKSGFRTLYHNPNRMRGFSGKERELIKRAATSGIVSDVLRTMIGSRLIPIITGASGGGLGATAAAQAGSMAARGMATRMQLSKAKDITKEISKRIK